MKNYFLLAFCLVTFAANAQSKIVKDSLMFTLSKPDIDAIFTGLGIPAGLVGIEYGVDVYRLIYTSMNYDSTPTIASGLVMLPKSVDYCALPIVSYQHGTILDKRGVPSRWVGDERFISLALAGNGLISIMPDYLGMGDGPGFHPYQNARTEAFSVVDMIRATKELCDSVNIGYSKQLFLFGYSQGGHATMAAHKMIQEQLSGEMQVTASAPMSGAYDMSGVQADLLLEDKPYSDPFYLPYLIFGNNPIYNLFTNPSDILKSPYDVTIPPLMDGFSSAGAINAVMNDTVKLIFKPELVDSFINDPNHFFRVFLKDNDIYEWVPTSPVRMYFCTKDEKVPFQNTYTALNYFLQNGAVSVDTVNSGDLFHTDCAQPSFLNAKFWIDSYRTRPLKVATATQPSSASSSTGTATVFTTDGLAPFTYLWSNGNTTEEATNLAPGGYDCTVTDANGCVKVTSVQVSILSGLGDVIADAFSVYPNPTAQSLTVTFKELKGSKEVNIIDGLGRIVFEQNVTQPSTTLDVQNLSQGMYTIRVANQYSKFIKQ